MPTLPIAPRDEDEDLGRELSRIEALLADRAADLLRERSEHERLRGLLRDALASMRAAELAAPPPAAVTARPDAVPGNAQLEQALARAIEAEAARAELAFRLDEAMGHLLSAGMDEAVEPGEPAHITCARLSGRVRGLLAALHEAEEARDMADARRVLAEHDLEASRDRALLLERQLAESREHEELEVARSRALSARFEGGLEGRAAAAIRGETMGLRARCAEAELALSSLMLQRIDVEEAAEELRSALGRARAELAARRAEADSSQGRNAELDRAIARESDKLREISAKLAQREAERLVMSDELARARAELLSTGAALDEARAEHSRALAAVDAQRAVSREVATSRSAQVARMADSLRDARSSLTDLLSILQRVTSPEQSTLTGDVTQPGTPSFVEAAGEGEPVHVAQAALDDAIRALRALVAAPQSSACRDELAAVLQLLGAR